MKRKRVCNNYIYQKKDFYPYHCGPFAIYNMLIKHNSHCDIQDIIKLCDPEPIIGTLCEKMDNAIRQINKIFNIKIKKNVPNITQIDKVLEKDGSVIILFHWTDKISSGEHYAMIESNKNNKYKIINYSFGFETKYITIKELNTMLLYHKRNDLEEFPKIWSLI
jgi:hypothetical protein